jgi:hypothetical protein
MCAPTSKIDDQALAVMGGDGGRAGRIAGASPAVRRRIRRTR